MKKVLSIILVVSIFIASIIVTYHFRSNIRTKQLNYSFLYRNYQINGEESIYRFTINNNQDVRLPLNNEKIKEAIYCNEGSKIIAITGSADSLSSKTRVIYYDLDTNIYSDLFPDSSKYEEDISHIKCVPNSNSISFINSSTKFTIYNINTKTSNHYDINLSNYTWTEDGKSILYSNYENFFEDEGEFGSANIIKYDFVSNTTSMFIKNGWGPVYSNNNRYIAFMRDGSLVIKDLYNNKEYKRKSCIVPHEGYISSYSFSPDSKYIIFIQYDVTIIGGFGPSHMVLWDFENNRSKKIKDHIRVFFDWQYSYQMQY